MSFNIYEYHIQVRKKICKCITQKFVYSLYIYSPRTNLNGKITNTLYKFRKENSEYERIKDLSLHYLWHYYIYGYDGLDKRK